MFSLRIIPDPRIVSRIPGYHFRIRSPGLSLSPFPDGMTSDLLASFPLSLYPFPDGTTSDLRASLPLPIPPYLSRIPGSFRIIPDPRTASLSLPRAHSGVYKMPPRYHTHPIFSSQLICKRCRR